MRNHRTGAVRWPMTGDWMRKHCLGLPARGSPGLQAGRPISPLTGSVGEAPTLCAPFEPTGAPRMESVARLDGPRPRLTLRPRPAPAKLFVPSPSRGSPGLACILLMYLPRAKRFYENGLSPIRRWAFCSAGFIRARTSTASGATLAPPRMPDSRLLPSGPPRDDR